MAKKGKTICHELPDGQITALPGGVNNTDGDQILVHQHEDGSFVTHGKSYIIPEDYVLVCLDQDGNHVAINVNEGDCGAGMWIKLKYFLEITPGEGSSNIGGWCVDVNGDPIWNGAGKKLYLLDEKLPIEACQVRIGSSQDNMQNNVGYGLFFNYEISLWQDTRLVFAGRSDLWRSPNGIKKPVNFIVNVPPDSLKSYLEATWGFTFIMPFGIFGGVTVALPLQYYYTTTITLELFVDSETAAATIEAGIAEPL